MHWRISYLMQNPMFFLLWILVCRVGQWLFRMVFRFIFGPLTMSQLFVFAKFEMKMHFQPSLPIYFPAQTNLQMKRILAKLGWNNCWKFVGVNEETVCFISSDRSSYSDCGILYIDSQASHFLRFRAFLPIYLVFHFEN